MNSTMGNSPYGDHTLIPTREIPDPPGTPPALGGPGDASGAIPAPYTQLQRHWLTGEWQEVPIQGGIITRVAEGGDCEKVLPRRNYERELIGLSIPPEQATPERIARENAETKRHNTGACYDRYGRCFTSSKRSQNRELRRRGQQNNDAGDSDYAGR